ncbi:hypothetical protein ACMHYB_01005 [Sorangium sp. So ce1128]
MEILRTERGGSRRLGTRQEQAALVCILACLAALLLASVLLAEHPPGVAVVSLEFDVALGFAVSDFAYPWGAHDSVSAELVRSCGYDSARGSGWPGLLACTFCARAESIPPRNPAATRTPSSLRRSDRLPRIQALVRRAQQEAGWMQLTIHHICDACGKYSISREDFSTLLDFLAEERDAGRVVVLTVRQVIHGATPPPRRLAVD